VIEQARLLSQGFALDDTSIALGEILEVGPGGSFLISASTLQHFRDASFQSEVFPNLTLEKWQEQGSPAAQGLLREHTRRLLESLDPPEDHAELMAEGEAFIDTINI
jgi:trimethylamine:corrinoid methyltransferase-like protein